jgi:methyl-accepting chemotaxis protein
MDGLWLQKLADYGWMLLLLVAEAVRRLYARVAKSEMEISTLRTNHEQRTAQLQEINNKIDRVGESVNMIVSKLIDRVPKA